MLECKHAVVPGRVDCLVHGYYVLRDLNSGKSEQRLLSGLNIPVGPAFSTNTHFNSLREAGCSAIEKGHTWAASVHLLAFVIVHFLSRLTSCLLSCFASW